MNTIKNILEKILQALKCILEPSTLESRLKRHYATIIGMLQIYDVPVRFVPLVFTSEDNALIMTEWHEEDLPDDANALGGFYLDGNIWVSTKRLLWDPEQETLEYRDVSEADLVFAIAHELRHRWQDLYQHDLYFRQNTTGFQVIADKSEIDADAFAIAYTLKYYSAEDMALATTPEMRCQGSYDGGARWSRAEEISTEYGLASTDAIQSMKNR